MQLSLHALHVLLFHNYLFYLLLFSRISSNVGIIEWKVLIFPGIVVTYQFGLIKLIINETHLLLMCSVFLFIETLLTRRH